MGAMADDGDLERSWFSTTPSLAGRRRRFGQGFLLLGEDHFCGDLSRMLWNAGTMTSRGLSMDGGGTMYSVLHAVAFQNFRNRRKRIEVLLVLVYLCHYV